MATSFADWQKKNGTSTGGFGSQQTAASAMRTDSGGFADWQGRNRPELAQRRSDSAAAQAQSRAEAAKRQAAKPPVTTPTRPSLDYSKASGWEIVGDIQQKRADEYVASRNAKAQAEADARAAAAKKLEDYANLSNNEDFAYMSRYNTTRKSDTKTTTFGVEGAPQAHYGDLIYDYINHDRKATELVQLEDQQLNARYGLNRDYLQQMTPAEIAVYNYLYNTEGKEAATQYTTDLKETLTARQRGEDDEYWAQYAREKPFESNVFSVVASPAKAASLIGQALDYADDGRIDQNAAYNRGVYALNAINDETQRRIESGESEFWSGADVLLRELGQGYGMAYDRSAAENFKTREQLRQEAAEKGNQVGSFLYGTTMSTANFLWNAAISGGQEAVSLALMGAGAAADAVSRAKDNGVSDKRAAILGFVAGAAEILSEKVSFETLFNADLLRDGSLKYIIKNALSEGGEEVESDAINWLAETFYDALDGTDQGEIMSTYRENVATYGEGSQATLHTIGDILAKAGVDFLGGALSGAAMASVGAAGYDLSGGRAAASDSVMTVLRAAAEEAQNGTISEETRAAIDADPAAKQAYEAMHSAAQARAIEGAESIDTVAEERTAEALETAPAEAASEAAQADTVNGYTFTVEQREDGQYVVRVTAANGNVMTESVYPDEATARDVSEGLKALAQERAAADTAETESAKQAGETGRRGQLRQYAQEKQIGENGLLGLLRNAPNNITVSVDEYAKEYAYYYDEGVRDATQNADAELNDLSGFYDVDAYRDAESAIPLKDREYIRRSAFQNGRRDVMQARSAAREAEQFSGAGMRSQDYRYVAENYGIDVADRVNAAAKKLGVEVRFVDLVAGGMANAEIRGIRFTEGDKVKINKNIVLMEKGNPNPLFRVLGHEWMHRVQDVDAKAYSAFADSLDKDELDKRIAGVKELYDKAGMEISPEGLRDEAVADYAGELLRDGELLDEWLDMHRDDRTLIQKLWDAIKSLFSRLDKQEQSQLEPARQKLLDALKAAEKAVAENPQASVRVLGETQAQAEGRAVEAADVEVSHSLKNDKDYMDAAIKTNGKTGKVSERVMNQAAKDRAKIQQYLQAITDMLPPDIEGDTFYSDSSYGGSEENTTVCVRSLAYEEFMDAVAEELGRPLTVEDTVFIAQEAMALTDKPECLYCYVAMDRKAYRQYLGDYIEQRDQFLSDVKSGMEVGLVEPVAKGKGKRSIPKDTAYGKYLNGRDNTENMYNRAKLWLESETLITKANVASASAMNEAALDPALRAQIDDANSYAQSASWAKKKHGYAAYNNHILKWNSRKVAKLNKMYGMRMYSFSDYSPAFILENMQMITDAAVKGLKVLGYTKELDFVRIFAPTGMNINISVFGYNDGNGGVAMDAMQGADWAQAQALREQYANVGCTFVATNDAQVEWALSQDWIDVVIPFHLVRTGANVAKMFGWTNYTDMSADKRTDGEKLQKEDHVYPYEHQNDKATFLELCRKKGLTPRFSKWADNPGYMKLVNETRQSEGDTSSVQPKFDLTFAKASIDEMVARGGYMQHIGGTSENMRYLAEQTAGKIMGGNYTTQSGTTAEQAELSDAVEPMKRQGGPIDLAKYGLTAGDTTGERFSLKDIVGTSGRNYGVGVYLDSTLLENLTETERVEMVRERVKELGGSVITAYDAAGNPVDVTIATPERRFVNSTGKRVPVNRDLTTKNRGSHIKQETVVLVDELITTASYDSSATAKHPHGWLDNNGLNPWDKWTTYVQEKNGSVWEATLHIANSVDGEKILYDIDPIKMVEQRGNSRTSTTGNNNTTNDGSVKRQSLKDMDVYNRTAVLKESTVDKYLADYAAKSSPNYAQAYIVRMSPADFVNLTTSRAGRQIIEQQTGDLNMDELQKANVQQPIQLRIDHETGEINGHEGRHRALALARAGVTSVPVLLFDSSNKNSKAAIDGLTLTGQDFGSSRSTATVTVNDVQPLSYANRDAVVEKFTKQPGMERVAENYGRQTARWSLKSDADYLAAVDRWDMETAQSMVDEAARNAGYNYIRYTRRKQSVRNNDADYYMFAENDGYGRDDLRDGYGQYGYYASDAGSIDVSDIIDDLREAWRGFAEANGYESSIDDGELNPDDIVMSAGAWDNRDFVAWLFEHGIIDYDTVSVKTYDGLIVFDSALVKSADPVTYDDDGDVIPLSQRFNPENTDIRYSIKSPDETPTAAQLMRENKRLEERVAHFKGQLKLTKDWTADDKAVRRLTRSLMQEFSTQLDAEEQTELAGDVKALVEYAHRGVNDKGYEARMQDMAYGIARDLVKNARALSEGSDAEMYREVRARLRAPMTIDQRYAHDIAPDKWGEWRRANQGKVNVSINGRGIPVDTAYRELSEAYPWLFPESVTNPADQVLQMVEAIETLEPVYENPHSQNMAYAIDFAANAVLEDVMDDALQSAPTFADRKKAQIQRERKKNWEYTQEMLESERAKRDEQIQRLKDYYAQQKEEQRRRKEARDSDREARQKLLRIARRLQNKKLPAVTRARLEQYIGDLDTVAVGITGKKLVELKELQEWYNERKANDPDFIADPATEKKLERMNKLRISQLSLAEVAQLTEILLNIENEIANERRLIDVEDRRDTRMMVLESIYNVEETQGSKKNLTDLIADNTLSPLRLLRRLTGYVDADPLYQRTSELADGQRKMLDYQMRAERLFSKWANDTGFIDRIRRKERIKITGIENGNPVTVEITPDMRMALYLHSMNDQNMRHIAKGGVTIPDIDLYLKGDLKDAYARGRTIQLTPSNVRSICSKMSEAERAYARAAHDYFNGMSRDEVNATSEKLVGYSIAGVEDYFPIETDRNFTKSNIDELKRDGTIEGMGFLKERVNASNAINLVPLTDVLNRSIKNHAKYVGLAIPIRNYGKLWGMAAYNEQAGDARGLRQAIGRKWGIRGVEAIENMITDLQSAYKRSDDIDKLFGKIRSNYAGAVLSMNFSVAVKQAASYPTAAAVLGWKPLAQAMTNVGRVDLDLISKYTPLQWYRSKGYSTQELGDIKTRQGIMDKVMGTSVNVNGRDVPLFNWIQSADLLTTRKLWKASEYYVRDNNKELEIGSEEYYKAVADIYNRVIEETQPNYTTMQRPQLMRSQSAWAEMLGMFKTQPFQNFNVLYDAIGELRAAERMAKNGDDSKLNYAKKNAANAVSSQIVQLAVFAAMTMAYGLLRGKDDKWRDKEGNITVTSILLGVAKNMVSGAFSMVPAGSDIYNAIEAAITGGRYYGSSSATMSAISDAGTAIVNAGQSVNSIAQKVINGEEVSYKSVAKTMEDLVIDLSKAFGIPVENVRNDVQIVMRQTLRASCGKYLGEYAFIRLTENMDSSYVKGDVYDLLYRAYQSDYDAHKEMYKRLIDDGFSEDSIKNAMEKRMKEAQGVKSVSDLTRRYSAP